LNVSVTFKKAIFANVKIEMNLLTEPSADLKVKAEVQFINRILFEKIQFLQKPENKNEMKSAFDEIKQLDVNLDDIHAGTFKIKNKLQRKELA